MNAREVSNTIRRQYRRCRLNRVHTPCDCATRIANTMLEEGRTMGFRVGVYCATNELESMQRHVAASHALASRNKYAGVVAFAYAGEVADILYFMRRLRFIKAYRALRHHERHLQAAWEVIGS